MRIRHALPALVALASLPAAAAPERALEPLAFLAGHCWKGELPDGKSNDEHCFSWVYDGKFLRDRHVVRSEGKAVYEGETIYYRNASGEAEYFYISNHGGYMVGRMVPEGNALGFPAASLFTGGKPSNVRGRWERVGDDAYEILREYETDAGWKPVRVRMKKTAG
jgi:hypothetical protein